MRMRVYRLGRNSRSFRNFNLFDDPLLNIELVMSKGA
jgi:hypothetical protein